MDELNRELRSQAIHLGLCNDWQELWKRDWSQEKMVIMMYRGLDFCIQHHYPSNDFIVRHFDLAFRRKNNVFVNDKYSVNNPKESLILGSSEMTVRYNADNHGIIHVRDKSSVRLSAKNRSFAIIHLYENAYISAEQLDSSRIVLVKHSPDVTIIADRNIKIREEYDYIR